MNTDISSAYIDSPLTITVIGLEGTTKQRDPCFVSVELWHGLHMLEKKETAVSKQLLVGQRWNAMASKGSVLAERQRVAQSHTCCV